MQTMETGKRVVLKKILFATDFSPLSNTALPYALAVARQFGAKLYGAHVASSEDYLFTAPDLWPSHLQKDGQLQQEVTARIDEQLRDVPHQALFAVGDVWNELSRLLDENDIDLLVVSTHGRTGTRKLLLGSIAEKIFRQAICPVLTVGPNVPQKSESKIQFRHILLATDFGKESLAALPFALSLAEEQQAQLTLLHVVEEPAAGIPDVEKFKASQLRRLKELVPPESEAWCHAEFVVEFGRLSASPAQPILQIARDREAHLIVLGVRPVPGAVSTVTHLTHTTAQHVVAHSPCPVLTVRAT